VISTAFAPKRTFKVIGTTTNTELISSDGKLEISQFRIKNLAKAPLIIKWNTLENSLLKQWDYSMCAYGECQIGIPKSKAMKKIEPGETGFIALHLFPRNTVGNGKVVFELSDSNNPENLQKVVFDITVKH